MSILERQIVDIPVEKLYNGADEQFGRMMKINVDAIPVKFKSAFEQTKEASQKNFKLQGVFGSIEIECVEEASIRLKNGIELESKLLADMFRQSAELVLIVATLKGYEALDEGTDDMLLKLFYDSWGTAFIDQGNKWLELSIAKFLEDQSLYLTHSFSPGQIDIPMEMQSQIFQALLPEEIGVTLNEKYLMHPKKSVSGILGIQTEKDENRIRPCDLCEQRATCPTAYV